MKVLQVKKYPVNNPILKQLIKYFWVITSDNEVNISHKLLPVNNIDIIIDFSSQMYEIVNIIYVASYWEVRNC